ncbi:M60 family metallopeptidase [Streptomyces sp. BE303]|uniref:M60 family metallopeptidase n=1 Tax=Streptomyces sp. BE303 TaxID=3002528 RepID=UPI002E78039C|nr:M60 family metallopeptidase [Streptomyces sp. BE303]MED7953649.1 M60 family metallopeptidase [Streptomyces sp. BE303]
MTEHRRRPSGLTATAVSLALLPLLAPCPTALAQSRATPSRAADQWSELRVLGQCLTVEQTLQTRLRTCTSELGEPTPAGQQWRLDPQGTLHSAVTGDLALGLQPGSTPSRGAPTAPVPAVAATGAWSYDASAGSLTWKGGPYVLDFNVGEDRATLYTPGSGSNQRWTFSPGYTAVTPAAGDAGELRTGGRCLTLAPIVTPDRSVSVEPCASVAGKPTPPTQRWTVTPEGQVQSSAAPYPVLDVRNGPGWYASTVVARPVSNGTDQSRWQYAADTGTLRWAGDPTLALDHYRNSGFAGLYPANGGGNQTWIRFPAADRPGTARTQAAPGAASATAESPTGATVRWTAPPGPAPAGYAVYRDGGRIAVTTDRQYRDGGLGPGGVHRYRITALSAEGAESAPGAEAALTAPACPRATGPDGLDPFVLPQPDRPYTVTLTGLPSAQDERQRQDLAQLPSDLRPTGLYLPPGAQLTATATGTAGTGRLRVVVGPPVGSGLTAGRRHTAGPSGATQVQDHRGGMVYLAFDGTAADRTTVTLTGDVQAAPVFVLGRTTAAEWRTQLAERPTRYAEFVAGRTVVTLTRDTAARFSYNSPETVLRHLECARGIEDAAAALAAPTAADATAAPGPDSPGVFPFHYTEVERRAGAAFATDGYMGFKDDSAPWIADGAATGWGIWHEQGHHRQQRSVEPSEVVEVSVNIYSLAVEKAFGRPSRLVAEKVYDSALPKVGTSGVSYADSFDAFEKLVMLQQLTLQYGENFWPGVQKLVRSAPPRGTDRWANLALVTSKVAAQDLTAFYRAWGVPLSAAAQQDIAALRLPPAPSTLSTRREP